MHISYMRHDGIYTINIDLITYMFASISNLKTDRLSDAKYHFHRFCVTAIQVYAYNFRFVNYMYPHMF